MNNKAVWLTLVLFLISAGIWWLGLWLGGCSTQLAEELIPTTTTATGSTTTTSFPVVRSWQYVGEPGFSAEQIRNISLFIDSGIPYAAILNSDYTASVMKYDGSWESLGSPGNCDQEYVSLSVYNGAPYITSRTQVYRYQSGGWENFGPALTFANNVSISIENGNIYIAYQDFSYDGRLTVKKYNSGSDNWDTVGNPGFANANISGFFEGTQLFVRNGVPYVAFTEAIYDDKATVMKYNSGTNTWVTVGNPRFSERAVEGLSLYVSEDGVPYAAFGLQQPPSESEPNSKATVMKYISTMDAWAFVGEPRFSAWDADYISLFVSNGVPYVAFKDTGALSFGRASLMKYNGANWEYVGEQGFSGIGHAATHTSLFIYNDVPYVAFCDVDRNNSAVVMRYF